LIVAQRADDGAELGERALRFVFDGGERGLRVFGAGGDDRSRRLGLQRDGRHVVRHAVVELAGELASLHEAGLLEGPALGFVAEADDGADGSGEEHHHRGADRVAGLRHLAVRE